MLTIAILNFQGKDYLEECLASIPASLEAERLLIDNASTDDSWKIAEKYGFRVVHASNKYKFITGINTALLQSNSDYIFFSQADVIFDSECIQRLVQVCQVYGNCIVQPIFLKNKKIDNAGMNYVWPGYGLGIHNLNNQNFLGPYLTDCATSISFITSRAVINRVGLYDPNFSPAYMEDLDWSIRSKKMGVRHVVCPDAVVHHRHNESFSKVYSKRQISDICRKNRKYLIKKHYRGLDRMIRILVLSILDFFMRQIQTHFQKPTVG